MAATIGIKIANGEFYSLVEENSNVRKRLVLTTVHDNQTSVQIDLYKSYTKSMADALYIGSIVVESIGPRPRGEPSVELVIASNAEGEVSADAVDLDASGTGGRQHLSVSLKSIEEDNRDYDIPDFELDQHEPPPRGLYEKAAAINEREAQKGFPWIILIIAGLALIGICLALWFFLFRPAGNPSPAAAPVPDAPAAAPVVSAVSAVPEPAIVPAPAPPEIPAEPAWVEPPAAETAPAVETTPVVQEPDPVPVIQAPEKPVPVAAAPRRTRPVPPVASYKVPATIPREGAAYKIRWGDTLWDISEAFYRNPWLYPRIARFNRIRNPDLIISGRTIRIPPRN
jgi:hypothetical protein